MNIVEMLEKMGVAAWAVGIILALMGIYLIAVGLERYIVFARNRRHSRELVVEMRGLLAEEGIESLGKVSQILENYQEVPLGQVVGAASEAFSQRSGNLDALDLVVGINRAVERTIERQTSRLKRGFGGLATIATTAPFVGLFGTVLGIITAFQDISKAKAAGGAMLDVVSAGISEALIMTAFGLLIAIPAVAVYNYLTSVVDRMVVDMDEVASEMVEAVVLHEKKA